jgi:hypothetical protein
MLSSLRLSLRRLMPVALLSLLLYSGLVAQTADPLKLLQYRSIGPFRGGRVAAVAGIPSQPNVYYFGGTGGGVWKTTDGGVNWEPVSDKFFKTGSVGAIDVSQSDPNVVYVGMGESPVRGNVSHGDGVYKSTDGGKTGSPSVSGFATDRPRPRASKGTRILFMSPQWDISGARAKSAAFFAQGTAARRGRTFCFAAIRQVPLTSRWTRTTRM